MATNARIIQGLPIGKWSGLLLPPYHAAPFGQEHRLAERKIPYVNTPVHSYTGTDSTPMELSLMFVNTVTPETLAAYGGLLFPTYWKKFLPTITQGTVADLDHPLMGLLRARCKGWTTEVTADNLAGIVVKVVWVRTNEDPSVSELFEVTTTDPAQLAATADAAARAFGIVPAPQRLPVMSEAIFGTSFASTGVSLSSMWNVVGGLLFAFDITVLTMLDVMAGDIDGMIDSLTVLDDVMAWQALDACISLRNYVTKASVTLGQANRPVGQRALSEKTTLDAFARTVGNTVEEIMGLNVPLLIRPSVPKGAIVRFYKAS